MNEVYLHVRVYVRENDTEVKHTANTYIYSCTKEIFENITNIFQMSYTNSPKLNAILQSVMFNVKFTA